MSENIRDNLEELKRLDITKTETVGEIVEAMKHCSFGARMTGEVIEKLCGWCLSKNKPLVIFTGSYDSVLGRLLEVMKVVGWFSDLLMMSEFRAGISYYRKKRILVLGRFTEFDEEVLYHEIPHKEIIFINEYNLAPPEKVPEGCYKDVVFADEKFVISVLVEVLWEKEGKKRSVTDFINSLGCFQGLPLEIHQGARTFLAMLKDPDCSIFLTLSGAMTIAKMGLLVCEMIDRGWVKYIASTGALIAHGLIEGVGLKHYKYDPQYCDYQLAQDRLNRVTDTLEPEENFDHIEKILEEIFLHTDQTLISPIVFNKMIGKYLVDNYPNERGILKSAYEKNIPVAIPAFEDSEIGNDKIVMNCKRKKMGLSPIIMQMGQDSQTLIRKVVQAKKMGIFTIGGGVPRNNTQNVAPLMEVMNERLKMGWKSKSFSYGVRICPDAPFIGHLSGCTYKEGMSWRKMDPNGSFAAIHTDATMIWPFLVRYAIENGF